MNGTQAAWIQSAPQRAGTTSTSSAGLCDGMTYEEIEDATEEFLRRKADKLAYRATSPPRGERSRIS